MGRSFVARLWNLFMPSTAGTSLADIQEKLEEMRDEMRRERMAEKRDIDSIGEAVARIEAVVRGIDDQVRKQGVAATLWQLNALAFSLYAVGLAVVQVTAAQYPGLGFIEGGIAVNAGAFAFALLRRSKRV